MFNRKVLAAASITVGLGALFMVSGLSTSQVAQANVAAGVGYGYGVAVVTEIHLASHVAVPCFDARVPCTGQVASAGVVVHDEATVTSENGVDPTGRVVFGWFVDNRNCMGGRPVVETVALSGSGGVMTAESSSKGPLAPGNYSFKAIYQPDASAFAKGFRTAPAHCEGLNVKTEVAG